MIDPAEIERVVETLTSVQNLTIGRSDVNLLTEQEIADLTIAISIIGDYARLEEENARLREFIAQNIFPPILIPTGEVKP